MANLDMSGSGTYMYMGTQNHTRKNLQAASQLFPYKATTQWITVCVWAIHVYTHMSKVAIIVLHIRPLHHYIFNC